MVLGFLVVGVLAGIVSFGMTLVSGGGLLLAFLAYAGCGALAVVALAALVAQRPCRDRGRSDPPRDLQAT